MTETKARSGRLQLALIALIFLGPLAVAAWMYLGDSNWTPEGRSNRGALLEPIVNVDAALPGTVPGDVWLLVYDDPDTCEEACRDALYTLRQSRLMLGKEMDRVRRVFLHGESPPDTLFLAAEHAGLTTIRSTDLRALLNNKRPAELPDGGYFLIDPLGNLVMYFRPDIDPKDMVGDIKHLLKLSRIG